MHRDANEEILMKLLEDILDALQDKKASRVVKRLWAVYFEARRAIADADRREALSR